MMPRVKLWLKRLGLVAALAFLGLTVLNASWLADKPKGSVKLIAQGGLHPMPAFTAGEAECPQAQIEAPVHDYIANTVPGIARAAKLGAAMVAVDATPTADGRIALFGDETLDCRTNGKGPMRAQTLEALEALDAGHGYTADDGTTFPLRGKGTGKAAIPALEEAIPAVRSKGLFYRLSGNEADADRLLAALKAAGRDPVAAGDGFTGSEAAIARVREAVPKAWAYTDDEAKRCTTAYVVLGWSGYVPESCRGGTMFVSLDRQWLLWGWPNRLIQRMEAHGTRIVIIRPPDATGAPTGLDLPEQLGEIPADFNGYALVDDGFAVIPALIQKYDDRKLEELEALEAALERRRAAR